MKNEENPALFAEFRHNFLAMMIFVIRKDRLHAGCSLHFPVVKIGCMMDLPREETE